MINPLSAERSATFVRAWLEPGVSCGPDDGAGTWAIAESLLRRPALAGNLVPDALVAATAIEHGAPVVSRRLRLRQVRRRLAGQPAAASARVAHLIVGRCT